MIQLKKVYSVFLLLISTVQLQAMVEFNLLENLQKKEQVLLIGFDHADKSEKESFEKNKSIMNLLQKEALKKEHSVQCIYDYDANGSEPRYKYCSYFNRYLHHTFSKEVQTHPYFKLKACHQNAFEWFVIHNYLANLNTVFSQLNAIQFRGFKNNYEECFEGFRRDLKLNADNDMQICEYFDSLNRQEEHVVKIRDIYKEKNELDVVKVINERIKIIRANKANALLLLNKYPDEQASLLLGIFKHLHDNCETIPDVLDETMSLYKTLLYNIDGNVASITYLHALLSSPASRTFYILGLSYAALVAKDLQKLDNNLIQKKIAWETDGHSLKSNWNEEYMSFFKEAIIQFANSPSKRNLMEDFASLSVQEKKLIGNEQFKKACNICKKTASECGSLKHCGYCKSVWYCSVNCQRSDWPQHKVTCEKKISIE